MNSAQAGAGWVFLTVHLNLIAVARDRGEARDQTKLIVMSK